MLSVVITAWNEETTLPEAITSVKDLADEVVVVDTESTDKTVQVAKKLGAKVYSHKNTSIVEPVRNFSISKASGDWVLLLDADERVTPELAAEIKRLLANPDADYYRIPRKSIIFGKWITSGHWWPDYVYRLFKKGHVKWFDQIHSAPQTQGTGHDLAVKEELALVHEHYQTISQFIDRMNRYSSVQADQLIADGYKLVPSDLLSKPLSEFINQYFSRKGYKEGVHGVALSLLQTFAELAVYLKVWQSEKFPPHELSRQQVQAVLVDKAKEVKWWQHESDLTETTSLLGKTALRLKRKLRP